MSVRRNGRGPIRSLPLVAVGAGTVTFKAPPVDVRQSHALTGPLRRRPPTLDSATIAGLRGSATIDYVAVEPSTAGFADLAVDGSAAGWRLSKVNSATRASTCSGSRRVRPLSARPPLSRRLTGWGTADSSTGIKPEYLRYRFTYCVEANVLTTVRDDVWPRSLDERLIDYASAMAAEVDGYVWGVNWQVLYPGLKLISASPLAAEWSGRLGFELCEATIEGNGHRIQLVFRDLEVSVAEAGDRPFEVPRGDGPDGKYPLSE